MRIFRKFLSLVVAFIIICQPVQASQSDAHEYIQRMIQYYLQHQQAAEEEIGILLDHLGKIDPQQETLWRRIMVSWAHTNSQMEIHQGILPDGLPQDDSMCIVIMGYGLNRDGTMRSELIDRLVVGLSSAMKYPNAYVAVTGGATSDVEGVTEAGQMAQWLTDRGISSHRLILETGSYSTVQNAKRVHSVLQNQYPQIRNLAVITSDYHVRQSCVLLSTAAHCASAYYGAAPMKIVGNAVCYTGKQVDDLYTQAWGIAQIAGISLDTSPETQPELSNG